MDNDFTTKKPKIEKTLYGSKSMRGAWPTLTVSRNAVTVLWRAAAGFAAVVVDPSGNPARGRAALLSLRFELGADHLAYRYRFIIAQNYPAHHYSPSYFSLQLLIHESNKVKGVSKMDYKLLLVLPDKNNQSILALHTGDEYQFPLYEKLVGGNVGSDKKPELQKT